MDFCKNCRYLKNLNKIREFDDVRGHNVLHLYECQRCGTTMEVYSEHHLVEMGCSMYEAPEQEIKQYSLFDFMS